MINLKIFYRKFVSDLVGYSPGPKHPLYLKLKKKIALRQKELKFHLQSDSHCFFGRASAMRSLTIFQKRDRQRF